ncbi:MAG: TadE/TadG family type IV pilus assembly protein [Pirellulaceae bacterium]|nr:TadE/TadG family type IV pilus assembly protein [Pirellulaceae bacterium]
MRKTRRRGAAVVEFAVCLPIIMLLIIGSIEATSAIFLRQALTTSAYEGIREAVQSGSTTIASTNRAQAILTSRQIRNSNVRFTPSDVQTASRGTPIVIEISAPFGANSPFMGHVIADRINTVRTVMIKE